MQLQGLNRNSLRLVIGFLSLATYTTTYYLCVCVCDYFDNLHRGESITEEERSMFPLQQPP